MSGSFYEILAVFGVSGVVTFQIGDEVGKDREERTCVTYKTILVSAGVPRISRSILCCKTFSDSVILWSAPMHNGDW